MATFQGSYGSNGQTITISLGSLANAAYRESNVIDNSSNKFFDALVQVTAIKTNGSAPTGDKACYVFAYATVDGGTTYTDGCTGSDAALTPPSPPNLKQIGMINMPSASTTYKSSPMSVAKAFDGILPEKWGIVILNSTGNALDSTGGNHVVKYQGIKAETA